MRRKIRSVSGFLPMDRTYSPGAAGGDAWCVVLYSSPKIKPIDRPAQPVEVTAPLKVHLVNGQTILFADGALFTADSVLSRWTTERASTGQGARIQYIRSPGTRYDLTGARVGDATAVLLDSVAAMETFGKVIDPAMSFVLSAIATPIAAVGAAALAVAIFGSCPTVYLPADSIGVQAELFSHSIVPLFEVRDVDAIAVEPDANGRIALQVRNEAFETHYINHLELLEVDHDEDEVAAVTPNQTFVLLRDMRGPIRAFGRRENEVTQTLRATDDLHYSTEPSVIRAAITDTMIDRIEIRFARPSADTSALYVRVRASLLHTVMFYESMLASQGAQSLEWLGRDLSTISEAISLGNWFSNRARLRIEVWDADHYEYVGSLGNIGPIAWEEFAVPFAVPEGEETRIRLTFLTDAFRIDQVALAESVRNVSAEILRPESVEVNRSVIGEDILAKILEPDESYLITEPGTHFDITFKTGSFSEGGARSYFLAGQGYYIEWIRRHWITDTTTPKRFLASDSTMRSTIRAWVEKGSWYEEHFYSSRLQTE